MSRTSGDGGSIWSNRRSRRTADAWEDFKAERCKDRQCPVSESDISNPGGKISFACRKEETLPEELVVTARSEDNEIMAMEHREYPIFGLQFHPESVMTPQGLQMIENFIDYAKALKEN